MDEKENQESIGKEKFVLFVIPYFAGVRANPLRFMEFKIPEDKPVMNLIESANMVLAKTTIELNKIFFEPTEDENTSEENESNEGNEGALKTPKIKKFRIQLTSCPAWYSLYDNNCFIGTLLIVDRMGNEPDINLLLVLKKEEI